MLFSSLSNLLHRIKLTSNFCNKTFNTIQMNTFTSVRIYLSLLKCNIITYSKTSSQFPFSFISFLITLHDCNKCNNDVLMGFVKTMHLHTNSK